MVRTLLDADREAQKAEKQRAREAKASEKEERKKQRENAPPSKTALRKMRAQERKARELEEQKEREELRIFKEMLRAQAEHEGRERRSQAAAAS